MDSVVTGGPPSTDGFRDDFGGLTGSGDCGSDS